MKDYSFTPIEPWDIPQMKAMVQGTSHSSMVFNQSAQLIFVMRHRQNLVGFITGTRGYGEEANVLTFGKPFTLAHLWQGPDAEKLIEQMELSFLDYAHDKLGVTSFRQNGVSPIQPIGVALIKQSIRKIEEGGTRTNNPEEEISPPPQFSPEFIPA